MKLIIEIEEKTYRRIQALVNADYFEHDICGYSMQRIANGIPYEETSQGEWIGKEKYDDYPNKIVCECSECGKMICVLHNDFPNFCEYCGAKMKGGAV